MVEVENGAIGEDGCSVEDEERKNDDFVWYDIIYYYCYYNLGFC